MKRKGGNVQNPNLKRYMASVIGSGACSVYAGTSDSSTYGGGTSEMLMRIESWRLSRVRGDEEKVYPKSSSVGLMGATGAVREESGMTRVGAGKATWASRSMDAEEKAVGDIGGECVRRCWRWRRREFAAAEGGRAEACEETSCLKRRVI